MSRYEQIAQDLQRQRDRLDSADRKRRQDVEGDVVIDGPRRLLLRSPNGTYFSIGVSDAGVLTTTNMGTRL